ncbi:MAG: hypothetical protein QOE54_990, partial [Streptosporangiaceae bacterium]|nr:hypothetical protein [Streptosporangiaceae bacterium]
MPEARRQALRVGTKRKITAEEVIERVAQMQPEDVLEERQIEEVGE